MLCSSTRTEPNCTGTTAPARRQRVEDRAVGDQVRAPAGRTVQVDLADDGRDRPADDGPDRGVVDPRQVRPGPAPSRQATTP